MTPDESSSFLSVVHRTIFVGGIGRSIDFGLDESVLLGLIDGEERIAARYDEALKAGPPADVAEIVDFPDGAFQIDNTNGWSAEQSP
ncbi:MAG: hypothetical protein U1E19_00675 [Rhodoblastus sp.]